MEQGRERASNEQVVRIEADLRHLVEDFSEMKEQLYGNGQPGKLKLMDDRISELEKTIYKILGAVGLGLVLIDLVMMWKK